MTKSAAPAVAEENPARNDDAEMFDLAPVSLWVEDYSDVKALFEKWRKAGMTDLRQELREELDSRRSAPSESRS